MVGKLKTVNDTADVYWSKQEERFLRAFRKPCKVQEYLDSLPYRCEDIFPPPTRVIRDNTAHCFDGALFAAAVLRRQSLDVSLINLRAQRDDDHLLCVYRRGKFFGCIAKSNFPSLRSREPVYVSVRELVMSYFDFYCNLDREKTLRGYSLPLNVSRSKDYSWEWRLDAADKLGDRIVARRHFALLTSTQDRALTLIDERLFRSQLVGVDVRGAHKN